MILTCSLQGAPLQLALSHVTLDLKRPFAISHIKKSRVSRMNSEATVHGLSKS